MTGDLLQWKIGDVRVTRIVEMTTPIDPSGMFPKATAEAMASHAEWLRPHFLDDEGQMILSIHCLVVESQGQTIVVDTCVGNGKSRPFPGISDLQTPFLADFRAAGFDPATIDVVTCTHLHFDHVGWNTMLVDGVWVPTFPNARYLFHALEWEHWDAEARRDPTSEPGLVLGDSVAPIVAAGLSSLVASDHRITDEVYLEPTPGHTPGHVSVHISSGGEEAVITGDMTHHPVQIAETDWGMGYDSDTAQGCVTRREFVDRYGDTAVLVIGTHFNTPTAGHVRRGPDGGWRFVV